MNHRPSSILFNYRAAIIKVSSPNSVTALVDHGFRSWSMRQFRIAGVPSVDARSFSKGAPRDDARKQIAELTMVLGMIVNPDNTKRGLNVLISPEKPAFSGHFSANMFMPVGGKPDECYCTKHAGSWWFDVGSFMRELCTGSLAVEVGVSFINSIKPSDYQR